MYLYLDGDRKHYQILCKSLEMTIRIIGGYCLGFWFSIVTRMRSKDWKRYRKLLESMHV